MEGLQGRKLLFAVALDEGRLQTWPITGLLSVLRRSDALLEGCLGGVVVTGVGEMYTKDVGPGYGVLPPIRRDVPFLGRPLVEATGSLRKFSTRKPRLAGTDEKKRPFSSGGSGAGAAAGGRKAVPHATPAGAGPACLAAGPHPTHTGRCGKLVKAAATGGGAGGGALPAKRHHGRFAMDAAIRPVFTLASREDAFYGGPMVEEVYPALRQCGRAGDAVCQFTMTHWRLI